VRKRPVYVAQEVFQPTLYAEPSHFAEPLQNNRIVPLGPPLCPNQIDGGVRLIDPQSHQQYLHMYVYVSIYIYICIFT
jgi:hypothetical protein